MNLDHTLVRLLISDRLLMSTLGSPCFPFQGGNSMYLRVALMGNYTAILTLYKYYPIPRISVSLMELYT